MAKKRNANSTDLAGRQFQSDDYNKTDELASGLAITHEQATDSLTEGTIDGKIENVDGEDIELLKE